MSLLILFDGGGIPVPPWASPINVTDIDVYSRRLIRIEFDDEIVVDDDYMDPSNYSIEVVQGSGPLEVVGVLPVTGLSSLNLMLITYETTIGTTYQVTAKRLSTRNFGDYSFGFQGNFVARDTKFDSILSSIPKHFDKRPTSILSSILAAIGRSDDIIGGSKNNSLSWTDTVVPPI